MPDEVRDILREWCQNVQGGFFPEIPVAPGQVKIISDWLDAQPEAPEPDWTYGDGYDYDCFVASVYGEGVYYFCEADVYWSNGLPDMDDVAALGHFVKQDIERGNDWRETLRRRPEVTP